MTRTEPAAADPPALLASRGVGGLAALLAGVGMLMLGVGLQQVLLGVRAVIEGFPTALTGLLMSSYFAGFLAGSLIVPRLIGGVGHIRTFAALASLASATVLVHAVQVDPLTWALVRTVNGICVAGLFVVAESWLNSQSTNESRGQLLSVYMVIVMAGLGGGQLMLNIADPSGFGLFVVVSILVSVAVVPLAVTPQAGPVVAQARRLEMREVFDAAPVALVGAVLAGVATGSLSTIGAVFARTAGLSIPQVSMFMAVVLLGAIGLQLPIGRLSDRMDRRRVIGASATVAAASAAAVLPLSVRDHFPAVLALMAVHGGASMPLYSLCAAHLHDRMDEIDVVGASGKLVMASGLGSVAGPLLATTVMEAVGSDGFLWHLTGVHLALVVYAAYRLTRLAPTESLTRYTAFPSDSTMVLMGVEPADLQDPQQPDVHGIVHGDGVTLHYTERGDGEPVVFVHDVASSRRTWDHQMRGRPSDSYRVIAYDLRGHGESTRATAYRLRDHTGDLETVIEVLGAAPAHIVGQGAGAAIAVALARRRPELVRTLTLVGYATQVLPQRWTPRFGTHAEIAVERGLSRIVGQTSMSRRLAAYHYDAERNPDRHHLIAEDARRADRDAIGRTRTAAAAARPMRLDGLHVPILIALGERDATAPKDAGKAARPARVVIIPGAGPLVGLDSPLHFNESLCDFLAAPKPVPGEAEL